jgi:hypothetical protein
MISAISYLCRFVARHDIGGVLVQELSEHTSDVHVQSDALEGMFTFYDTTKATLNVYQVRLGDHKPMGILFMFKLCF